MTVYTTSGSGGGGSVNITGTDSGTHIVLSHSGTNYYAVRKADKQFQSGAGFDSDNPDGAI